MRKLLRGTGIIGMFLLGLLAAAPPALAVSTTDLKTALVDDATTLANVTSLTVDAGVLSTAAADTNPGFPSQITVLSAYLPGGTTVLPTKGGSFVALSSGDLFVPGEASDVDYGTVGPVGDTAKITLVLTVPTGSDAIAFDFDFLSHEFPEFVGSSFNDFFTVELTDASGTRQIAMDAFGNAVTINTVFFNSSLSLLGTGFEVFNDEPSGPDAGRTGTLTTLAPLASGTTSITISFSTGDVGDGIFTSSAVIDNLRFTTSISDSDITGVTTPLSPGVVTDQGIFTDLEGNRVMLDAEILTGGALTVFAQQASTNVSPGRFPSGSGLSLGGDAMAALYTIEAFEGLTFSTTQNGGSMDLTFVVDVPGPFDPTMGLCTADDETSGFADITSAPAECILSDGSPCETEVPGPDEGEPADDPTRVSGTKPELSQFVGCHRDPVIELEGGASSLGLCLTGAGDPVTLEITEVFNPNPAALTVRYTWTVPTSSGPVMTTTLVPEITFVPPLGSSTATVFAELLDSSSAVVGTSATQTITLDKPSFAGFLDPLENDGSTVLNQKNSLPVKFRVVCGGSFVSTLTVHLEVEKSGDISSGGGLSSGNSNINDVFKYDAANNLYRYTLQSKTLTAGVYTIRVTFDGGILPKQEVVITVE